MSNTFAIETHALTKRFGKLVALDGVSAHVPTGSIYGLLGPNGAGKTTFLRVLLNLIDPTSGSGTVLGRDVLRDSVEVRRRVGHAAALQPLWDWMTAREFGDFIGACYPRWEPGKVWGILDRVGIDRTMKIQTLSRGQRAVVALAAAVGHEPDLLLLDEALTGLDPIARREVLRNIVEAMHSEGRTVFITGQDIAEMERICDHIGFLIKGKLFLEAPLDEIKARVKRLRIEHAPEAAPGLPAAATDVARAPRETLFTIADFTPEVAASLEGGGGRVEVLDLSLEEIFIALAQPVVSLESRS